MAPRLYHTDSQGLCDLPYFSLQKTANRTMKSR